jgi:SynChlorMet cassette protein ScmC
MSDSPSMEGLPQLHLGDGAGYRFAACDEVARPVVAKLADVMALVTRVANSETVLVSIAERTGQRARPSKPDDGIHVAIRNPRDNPAAVTMQVATAASAIALDVETRGGLLLHGALALREGQGVVLAGPATVGKTTASGRLPPPWRSLCDDATLVVRDAAGAYWAHPWPTWSRFVFDGPGGTWDVQRGVPLRGLFFLAQDEQDWAEPVGAGQAVTLLVAAVEQVVSVMQVEMEAEELRLLRLRRFDNICALAKAVPCYELHLSLTGAFWEEMERVLDLEGR